MGAANKAQGRASRRPAGQTTRWAPPMLADPPTCRASPPAGHPQRRCSPCRFRLGRGDARGEAPCIRKLKAPFPTGRGGRGMGAANKDQGRASRRPAGQATRRAPARRRLQVPQAVQCRGTGGEAPGEINFETPPSPEGEGGQGDGGKKSLIRQEN